MPLCARKRKTRDKLELKHSFVLSSKIEAKTINTKHLETELIKYILSQGFQFLMTNCLIKQTTALDIGLE